MTAKRLRLISVLSGLGCSAVALIAWSQTWYLVTLADQFAAHPNQEVGGAVAAPAISALALAAATGFAAMTIAGRFFQVLLAALEIVVGASISLSAFLAITSPVDAVSAAVTEATGLEGKQTLLSLIASISPSVWPTVSVLVGVLLALVGIGILVSGHRWPQSSRRYEPVRFAPVRDEPSDPAKIESGEVAVSDWDELSGGSDPTSG